MSVLLRMRGVLKRSKGEWLTFLDGACGFVSERCKLFSWLLNRSGSVGVDLLLLENFIKTLQAALTWPCKTSQRGDSGTILKEQKQLHVNLKSWTHLTMTTLGFDQKMELERGWEHGKARSLEVTTGPGVSQTLNSAIHQASVVQRLDSAIRRIRLYPVDSPIGRFLQYLSPEEWFIQWIVLSNVWTEAR